MTLYLIGLGLNNEKDISLKGLEAVKKCKYVFLENYTSILQCTKETLEKLYKRPITLANRELVENKTAEIVDKAKNYDVAFLVIGDPMAATTHISLMLEAKNKDIPVKIIYNASILNAAGITGLQLYKFGKTTSIPFFEEFVQVEAPYNAIKENLKAKLHTLALLDLDPSTERFMTVNDAIEILLKIEKQKKQKVFTPKTFCIGCARLGSEDFVIKAAKAGDLLGTDFGKPPHCLIIPAKELHFMEEETLKLYKI